MAEFQSGKQCRLRPVKYVVLSVIILLAILVNEIVWRSQVAWYFIILLGLVLIGYIPSLSQWTGFGAYDSPKSDQYDRQRKKTLWDWLTLLIIPVILAGGGLWFNAQQNKQQEMLAEDQRKETTLKTYMDDISGLLFDKGLRNSQPDDRIRSVATAKTQVALRVLDPQRRSILVRFLVGVDLISGDLQHGPVISLTGMDLSHADLSHANLSHADLSHADLSYADLSHTYLSDTDLSNTDLSNADLSSSNLTNVFSPNANLANVNLRYAYVDKAFLEGTNLSNSNLRDTNLSGDQLRNANLDGAIMPDGSKHPSNSSTTSHQIPDLKPFIGSWSRHGGSLMIEGNGHATYVARAYQWCGDGVKPPCDTIENNFIKSGIRMEISFNRVVNHVLYGIIIATNIGNTVNTVSVKLATNGTIVFTENNSSSILCGPNAPPSICGA